jgi:hypothetical protein
MFTPFFYIPIVTIAPSTLLSEGGQGRKRRRRGRGRVMTPNNTLEARLYHTYLHIRYGMYGGTYPYNTNISLRITYTHTHIYIYIYISYIYRLYMRFLPRRWSPLLPCHGSCYYSPCPQD